LNLKLVFKFSISVVYGEFVARHGETCVRRRRRMLGRRGGIRFLMAAAPGTRRTRKRPTGPPTDRGLTVTRLAAILGVPIPDVHRRLRGVARGTARRYSWRDVCAALDADELARARDARFRLPSSRRWVAGYPALIAEWDRDKNGELYPDETSYGSNRKVWWRCDRGPDHQWQAVVASRVRGCGCPFCAGQRVSVTNSLATRAPEVAAEWHPTQNGALGPGDLVWSSGQRVVWRCQRDPTHEWSARVNARTSGRTGCPFCNGRPRGTVTSDEG